MFFVASACVTNCMSILKCMPRYGPASFNHRNYFSLETRCMVILDRQFCLFICFKEGHLQLVMAADAAEPITGTLVRVICKRPFS